MSEVSKLDLQVVKRQLERSPRSLLRVALRCPRLRPMVIENHPVSWASGHLVPMPTLYWLSCPLLARTVAKLESEGMIGKLTERCARDRAFRMRLVEAHREYAVRRQSHLGHKDQRHLARQNPSMRRVLSDSGIGGCRDRVGIKCLHAHYAFFLVGGQTPVGEEMSRMMSLSRVYRDCTPCREICLARFSRIAGIDIGSNSSRLLIGDGLEANDPYLGTDWYLGQDPDVLSSGVPPFRWVGRRVFEVTYDLATNRLRPEGGGKRLMPKQLTKTEEVMRRFAKTAKRFGCRGILAVGTNALREAEDAETFCGSLAQRTGVNMEVISGEREAYLSLRGVAENTPLDRSSSSLRQAGHSDKSGSHPAMAGEIVVVDIGGGSTEVTVGAVASGRLKVEFAASTPLGALRLTQRFFQSDPPTARQLDELRQYVLGVCQEQLSTSKDNEQVIAVGGTATTLAQIDLGLEAYEPVRLHGHAVTLEALHRHVVSLANKTLGERQLVVGLAPERADIIVAGLVVLHTLMEWLDCKEVVISEAGLLYGLLGEALDQVGEESLSGSMRQ